MHFTLILRLSLLVGISVVFGACASVSVKNVERGQRSKEVMRPKLFVVTPFSVNTAGVKEKWIRKNPGALASESQQLIQTFLIAELQKLGIPATAGGLTASDSSTWVISGNLTRVAEGSRILRMGVGLGLGGTKMETQVDVRSGARSTPFLRFATTGGSNATPGAATMPIPFSSLPIALWNAKDGVTADAARTARMIRAAIAEYMAERGWIPEQKEKPKMKKH